MDDVTGAHPLRLTGNRSRNHAAGTVPGAQQRHMVYAIEERDDGFHRIWISESGERRFQLRGLHRKPEHVNGRHFRSDGDIHREISEGTFQPKLFGIVLNRPTPDNQRDGSSSVRQTSAD